MRNIHIIPHTHWDREWYRPYQYFRVKLVYVIDKMIEILEADPEFKHFLLDGQSVVLEDYLQVKPENSERLWALISAGRVDVGPWYIQPDEFAPDGESMVRNLLIGIGIAEKFGGSMMIGYLPDSFGQSGQMPHILRGFGIDSAVVMRGVDADRIGRSEFIWDGINGEEVLAIYLPEGYSNAMFLPEGYSKARARLSCMIGKMRRWAATSNILVMNGVDHQFPQTHISGLVKRLNARSRRTQYQISTLERYIKAVRAADPELPRLHGDLLVPARNRVHTSIASTRIYQKQKNRKMESLMARSVEPVSVIGWLAGAEYPTGLINQAWKILLQNQTHDGIGGCCTDEVHRDMDQRFEDVKNIGETLRNAYSRAISQQVSDDQLTLTVFNNAMTKGQQIVRASVYLSSKDFSLLDPDGKPVPYQIDRIEEVDLSQLSIWTLYLDTPEQAYKIEITFEAEFDFNLGYQVYHILEKKPDKRQWPQPGVPENRKLENDLLQVEINPNGSLTLLDKTTGIQYPEILIFEDCGDAGDTYNFSPVKDDTVVSSKNSSPEIKLLNNGTISKTAVIRHELEIPLQLANQDQERSDETVIMPITTWVTLYTGQKQVACVTEVENTGYDHRLRVLFPTGVDADYSFAETQFGTVKRPISLEIGDWKKEKLDEKPLPIYAMQKFVDLYDGDHGLAVLNRGLTEYEIYGEENGTIAVTLLRGVGMMGKGDLLIRPGRPSGMRFPTPDAQCLGFHRLEYAIVPHAGDLYEENIPARAVEYDAEPLAVQSHFKLEKLRRKFGAVAGLVSLENLTSHIRGQLGDMETGESRLFSIDDDRLLISAVKKAERENALIIRLYNSCDSLVETPSIQVGFQTNTGYLVSFNEEEIHQLPQSGSGRFSIPDVKPFTAVTIKFSVD